MNKDSCAVEKVEDGYLMTYSGWELIALRDNEEMLRFCFGCGLGLTVAFDLLETYAFLLTYCTTFQLSLYIKSSISCMRVFQSSIAVSTNVKMFVSLLLLNVYKLYFNGHWAVLHPARRPLVGVHMRTLLT